MTVTRGTMLALEGPVSSTYDVGKRQGYQVEESLTVDGTPTEASIKEGVWAAIEEAGDLPVYVRVRKTYVGHLWPWSAVVSKFEVSYQAVHMAEGTTLVLIAGLIWTLLPLVVEFLFVLLKVAAITWAVLKTIDVAKWIEKNKPGVAAGLGIGVVILAALVLSGDKK